MKKPILIGSICLLACFVFARNYPAHTKAEHSIEKEKKEVPVAATTPTVTTTVVTNILQISASGGGSVTSTGTDAAGVALTLTNKGVCWSTTPGPTIAGWCSADQTYGGSTCCNKVGTFTSTFFNLQPVTTYYYRAYAANVNGITYGTEYSFTTSDYVQGVTGGRKFYFSSTGNDATGTGTLVNPWQSLDKLSKLVTNGTVTFQPGDTVAFKCGETFFGRITDNYTGGYWANTNDRSASNWYYWSAPSGTPAHPIVITSYGTGAKPNWLHGKSYPQTSVRNHYVNGQLVRGHEGRAIFMFGGVHDIILDGIQCNDYRMTDVSKNSPGYSGGLILGEFTNSSGGLQNSSASDTTRRKSFVRRFSVRNCDFKNTMYGIQDASMWDSKITGCTFTNFKATADTFGTHDVGAGAIDGLNGFNVEISNNYFQGAWAKFGRIGSCGGLGGIALDIFVLKNSRIAYNTFVDCSGVFEIGNLERTDSAAGSQYDTFAFNKVVNCGQFGVTHVASGDAFQGNNHNIYMWNNVMISNHKDRHIGPGFGDDIYGDGQGFAQQMWFFRGKAQGSNLYPKNPRCTTTKGSAVVTVSDTTGIKLGSVAYAEWNLDTLGNSLGDEDTLLGITPKTTTVISIDVAEGGAKTVTLSDTATASRTNTSNIKFYLPIADTSWSQPYNSAYNNIQNATTVNGVSSNTAKWGNAFDTLTDWKNNVVYVSNGIRQGYTTSERSKFKKRNNIYLLRANYIGTTLVSTGNQLGTAERILTSSSKMFVDTSAAYPENWDLHLMDTTATATPGVAISGFTVDFAGNPITTPFVGLYKYSASAVTPPAVSTSATTSVTASAATIAGNVTADGGATVTRRGLIYSTLAIVDTTTTTGGGKVINASTGIGSYTASITGLAASTLYHVRAFALNSAGITYGADSTFTTINALAIVTTTVPYAVTISGAVTGGNVTSNGSSTVTRKGLIYSTGTITDTTNTTGGGKIVSTSTGTGVYTSTITGRTSATTYFVRAFAVNASGVSYGDQLYFTTLNGRPIVTTNTATLVSYTSATIGGTTSIPTGASAITRRGIIYSTGTITDSTSTTGGGKVIATTAGSGTFTAAITGLATNTLYHIKAFAINASGIVYEGAQFDPPTDKTFTTLTPAVPSIATTAAATITSTGAKLGGNITSANGATITRRGVIYSTGTITDTTSTTGGGKALMVTPATGSYVISVTGLIPFVTYNARAFGVNAIGVSLGSNITFKTTKAVPTITSFTPTSGAAGTLVTINGTNLLGATSVTVAGMPVTSYTVVSATRITANVGPGTSGKISVTTPSGTATSTGTFTLL